VAAGGQTNMAASLVCAARTPHSVITHTRYVLPACLQVEVSMDEDDEPEVELTGDAGAPVDVSRVPIIVSVSQVRGMMSGSTRKRAGHPPSQ
jgi:hypothetical protein